VTPEHIGAGVGRIGKDAKNPRMGQSAPEKFAVPSPAIRAPREAQIEFIVALHDGEGCVLSREQVKDRADCALDLLIRIERDLVALKDKSDWQGETQFALGRLVEFTPMEAGADNV